MVLSSKPNRSEKMELRMITVEAYINGEKSKINQSRNVFSANLKYIVSCIANAFAQPAHHVIVVPFVIPGKDLSLGKNLPDILFKITNFVPAGTIPYADQLRDDLLESCIDMDSLYFKVGLANRSDQHAHSTHRPPS